jgi:hypothetical protein
MVEVFKTTVQELSAAKAIMQRLSELMPHHCINFDLEDCDRILRVEGENIDLDQIILTLTEHGFCCVVLD